MINSIDIDEYNDLKTDENISMEVEYNQQWQHVFEKLALDYTP